MLVGYLVIWTYYSSVVMPVDYYMDRCEIIAASLNRRHADNSDLIGAGAFHAECIPIGSAFAPIEELKKWADK